MDKITVLSKQVADIYHLKGVPLKLIDESADTTSWYVDSDKARRASTVLGNNIKGLVGREHHFASIRYGLPQGGAIVAISERRLTDADYRPLIAEARRLYGELSKKLDNITLESQYHNPTQAMEKSSRAEAFPASIEPFKKRKRRKGAKERIQEALDGLATPDNVQPEESLKALFKAMKESGLIKRLPAAGIKWHIPANKHSITFLRDKVPVLQLNLSDLNNEKELTQTLLSLEAMSSGEAPQANAVTADYIKDLAAKVRNKERNLSQLAARHAPNAIAAAQVQQQVQAAQATGQDASAALSQSPQNAVK